MRVLVVISAILCVLGAACCLAADAGNQPASPVLVELFTSEGCSSCPPADALLERMDASQLFPGTPLIVLSEHVDYWDHDGWKDPFSLHSLSERQDGYARTMGLNGPYTPQFVVDGTKDLRGDAQNVAQVLQQAASAAKLPVHIGAVTIDSGAQSLVHAQVEVDGSSAKHNADVYVALALDHAESQVLHGENGGRHLTYVAVVESLTKVGRVEKGQRFQRDVALKFNAEGAPPKIRVIAFVQESGPGKVLGAAMQKD